MTGYRTPKPSGRERVSSPGATGDPRHESIGDPPEVGTSHDHRGWEGSVTFIDWSFTLLVG